nr:MAG: hypothetical protein [Bacteriophage sp.]
MSSLVHSIPYAAFSKVGINAAEPQAGLPCSLIIKLSPLDTPSKLGKCLSPSASSFSIMAC